jgi:hypothetical protein
MTFCHRMTFCRRMNFCHRMTFCRRMISLLFSWKYAPSLMVLRNGSSGPS